MPLILKICDRIGLKKKLEYSSDDFLRIAQIFYNEIGKNDDEYYSFIRECLSNDSIQPNGIHKMLFELTPASILTTNFDELIETAAAQECYSLKVIASDKEVPSINGSRFLLKVHGDLRHQNIVFKEEDYLNYSDDFKLIETILKSIFSTNTVIFIGYGLNDYNIKLVLNWAKNLLKENFNKPFFIYTEDEQLSSSELEYHESRGLTVIDFHKYVTENEYNGNYFIRYQRVLEAILKSSSTETNGKDKYELFNGLFELVSPLNKMMALRPDDVTIKLSPYVIINENGIISNHPSYAKLLEYFFEISKMSSQERKKLPVDIMKKYHEILSVFNKALIFGFSDEKGQTMFEGVTFCFSYQKCLEFSYIEMRKFVSKSYVDLNLNYQKAFYLAKLNRFKESCELFSHVATSAFHERNYLLYYLAHVNLINISLAIKSINKNIIYYGTLDNIEIKEIDFNNFPVDFQKEYSQFKDLSLASTLLYKNFYDSYVKCEGIENVINNSSITFGSSKYRQILRQIDSNLHFILGNCLYLDDFSEFKNAIIHLMTLLIQAYAVQNKSVRIGSMQEIFGKDKVVFDIFEFYCFIEYFDASEIIKLFSENNIEEIEFVDTYEVEKAVENLLNYYDKVLSKESQPLLILPFELKIKTCLSLLGFINISQKLVDEICYFIFKYEFREILIDDKIRFLNAQLYKRKMNSAKNRKILSNKFIQYFDEHLLALQNNVKYPMYSHSGHFYYELIHYVSENNNSFPNQKLSYRISKAIKMNHTELMIPILSHYYNYLSTTQQQQVCRWVKNELINNFSFDIFYYLLNRNNKINKRIINELHKYLNNLIAPNNTNGAVKVFPLRDKYDDLIQVGYFCFIGFLEHKDFQRYLGIYNNFDFYFLYEKFNFLNFDVKFLLHLSNNTCREIASNQNVKKKIRENIVATLKKNILHPKDENKLIKILINYFC
ncbi:MAG: SIR2 family protein [Candidatus Gastranaerophilaceae bacterium]|nr:SIR2 family protein [Candidatus Gastranaerophilaceae bacterium]